MANSVIGALRVNLGLDSAQFTTGAKKAGREADGLSKRMSTAFKGVALGVAAVTAAAATLGVAISSHVREAAEDMDRFAKSAQKIGIAAPELQKLEYAAGLAGVEAGTLQKALGRLAVGLSDIGRKGAPEASRELEKLGIKAGTGSLDAVKRLAEVFSRIPDGAGKSAAAIKILGKSGADLIPLFNGGAAAIEAAGNEAERFGIVIDTKTLQAAELFNDNLSRLAALSEGITKQFTAGLLPAISSVTSALVQSANVGEGFRAVGAAVGNVLVSISERASNLGVTLRNTADAFLALKEAGSKVLRLDFSGARQVLSDADDRSTFRIKLNEVRNDMLREAVNNFQPGEGGGIIGSSSILTNAETAGPSAAAKAAAKIRADIDAIVAKVPEIGLKFQTVGEKIQGALINFPERNDADLSKRFGIDELIVKLPDLNAKFDQAFGTATRFGESLAQNLSQALVFGQSLGQALVSSIRAAAAELITSGLLNMLLGQSGPGGRSGGLLGTLIKSVAGFERGTGSAPGGLAMVGERGKELVNLPRGARVFSNRQTEGMLSGGGQQRVVVDVQPSPLFVTTVRDVSVAAGVRASAEMSRSNSRRRMAGAFT